MLLAVRLFLYLLPGACRWRARWFFLSLRCITLRGDCFLIRVRKETKKEGEREGGQHHREKVVRVIKKTSIRVYVIAVNRLQYAEKKIFESKKENQEKRQQCFPLPCGLACNYFLKKWKKKKHETKEEEEEKRSRKFNSSERTKENGSSFYVCVLRVCDGIRGWME